MHTVVDELHDPRLPSQRRRRGGTSGGTGGRAGGSGGFTGSLGGSSGTTGTCADLLACCNAANATFKATCMTEYNTVVSMGDATCGALPERDQVDHLPLIA